MYCVNSLCLRFCYTRARASATTHGAEAGLEVATLREGGGWRGNSVLTYIRSERPLQSVQLALYDGLNGATANLGTTANTL